MKLTAVTSAALLTAGLLVSSGGAAVADSAHLLGLSSYRDMVVDQAHGRVFVSGGSVVTANLSGAVTGTVAGISSARQMALTADGSQLVVANGDGLTVVDAATAGVVRTIPTGANSCPDAVAPSSGLMFFTYGDCTGGTRGLGAVDLASDTITLGLTTGVTATQAQLVAVPSAPSVLAARFGYNLVVLDTTAGTTASNPTSTVRASHHGSDSYDDIALTPDGTKVVTASGAVYHHEVFSTTDLSHVGDYDTSAYPNAVAIRASDGYVAAGINGGYDPDVWFFTPGSGTASRTIDYGVVGNPGDSRKLMPGGLAFGAKNAYAVTGDVYDEVLTLRTIYTGPAASMSLTTNASSYKYGATATVTARLISHTTSRTVSIYATGAGTAKRLIKTGTASSTGYLTVKVRLTRNTTFSASFDGDDDYSAGAASRTVKVGGHTALSSTAKTRSGSYHLFKAGSHPVVTGVVSSANPNGCVRLYGQRLVGKTWRTFDSLSCLRLPTSSRFTVKLLGTYPAGTKVRILADFRGGSVNSAAPRATYYLLSRR